MKRIFFLLTLIFLIQLPMVVLSDKGQQKFSEAVEVKKDLPAEVVEVERVCGWTESNFLHAEQGSHYNNFGVSSFGSGVFVGSYNNSPVTRTVYGSSYSCSPEKFDRVITKKEPVNE